jgi:hypothetical protein
MHIVSDFCCSVPLTSVRQWTRSVSGLHTSHSADNEPVLTAAWQTANTFRLCTLIGWPSRVMQNHRTVFYCLLILNTGECDVQLGLQCTLDRITSVHLFIHSSLYSPHCPCVLCCKMTRSVTPFPGGGYLSLGTSSSECEFEINRLLYQQTPEFFSLSYFAVLLFYFSNKRRGRIMLKWILKHRVLSLSFGLNWRRVVLWEYHLCLKLRLIDWICSYGWCHWCNWLISVPKCSSNRF